MTIEIRLLRVRRQTAERTWSAVSVPPCGPGLLVVAVANVVCEQINAGVDAYSESKRKRSVVRLRGNFEPSSLKSPRVFTCAGFGTQLQVPALLVFTVSIASLSLTTKVAAERARGSMHAA